LRRHDDRTGEPRHSGHRRRVVAAVIRIRARVSERALEGPALGPAPVVRVAHAGTYQVAALPGRVVAHDLVRGWALIGPGHGRAGLDVQGLRREIKVSNHHLLTRGVV